MSATSELDPTVETNAIDDIAAIPTTSESVSVSPAAEGQPPSPVLMFWLFLAAFGVMFFLSMFLPTLVTPPAPALTPAPVAVTPAAAPVTPVAPPTAIAPAPANPRRVASHVAPAERVQVHHLYGQDYNLTWKSMGEGLTYRVYYADNRLMKGASEAYFKPVDGTSYRFTLNDAKNAWMAIAPIDASGHQGPLSRGVNVGSAQ